MGQHGHQGAWLQQCQVSCTAPGQDAGTGSFFPRSSHRRPGTPSPRRAKPTKAKRPPGGLRRPPGGLRRPGGRQQEGGGGCSGAGELGREARCGGSRGSARGSCGVRTGAPARLPSAPAVL